MHPAIETYIKVSDERMARAVSFAPQLELIEDVRRETGELIEHVYLQAVTDPELKVAMTATSREQVATVLRAFGKRGIRQVGEACDVPSCMCRVYQLTDGIQLDVHLRGKNCRRVEVGTLPKYEIVCDS